MAITAASGAGLATIAGMATPPRWRRSPTNDRYDDAPRPVVPWHHPDRETQRSRHFPAITITRSCSHGVCDERRRAMPRRLRAHSSRTGRTRRASTSASRRKSYFRPTAAHADPNHAAVVRMLIDHVLIRRDVTRLPEAPPLALLHELGQRLADHVKLEENELFPLIERTIPEPELSALGDRLGDAARPRPAAPTGNTTHARKPHAGNTP